MEFVPSISRSSGLGVDGDVLKDFKVQKEYRTFIESKLQTYWSQFPMASHLIGDSSLDAQRNLQSNILILFRKLREGLIASKRMDDFTLEVYETSLDLSVLFRTPAQTTSIVNQLVPHRQGSHDVHTELAAFYRENSLTLGNRTDPSTKILKEDSTPATSSRSPRQGRQVYRPPHLRREQSRLSHESWERSSIHSERQTSSSRPNILSATVISVLHTLVHSYSMKPAYHSSLNSFRQYHMSRKDDIANEIFKWLKSIATAVILQNYVRFETLTRSHEVDRMLHRLGIPESHGIDPRCEMRRLAVECFIRDLRTKMRETVWGVLTVAYRELDTTRSSNWFLQSLMIDPIRKGEELYGASSTSQRADGWLKQRGHAEARKKEGSEGGWILYRRGV